MTNDLPTDERLDPGDTESGFARLEREGAEAMAKRPVIRDADGRLITDPGQDMRAPEEEASVRQARLDDDSQREDRDRAGTGAPR